MNVPFWTMYKPENTPTADLQTTPRDGEEPDDSQIPLNEGNDPL
jgi:hypothetical protein